MHKKVVVFVDGENLVMRYQEMVANGSVPKSLKVEAGRGPETRPIVKHVHNSFVWSPVIFRYGELDLLRVNYYTSVVGDDKRVAEVTDEIACTPFWVEELSANKSHLHLIPRVHKKPKQSNKTKVVDVDITMDIMRAALTMPIDVIMLLSGDGDYVPLIREIARSTSKQVYLGAFSLGLADGLRSCAEYFSLLDGDFFEPTPIDFGLRIRSSTSVADAAELTDPSARAP